MGTHQGTLDGWGSPRPPNYTSPYSVSSIMHRLSFTFYAVIHSFWANVNVLNVKGSNYLCFGGGAGVCISILRIGKRLRDDLLRDTVAEVTSC